ncbi:hypothetical protein DRN63_01100 [Nanoarchaeota archaeon]|nr:MAG: hypothetical protein DRN63_01100 [Nanoarchaeota archaeon]
MRSVLANLGFLLQLSGFFLIPSIFYAFYLNEVNCLISLLITSLTFLCLGFLLNALCERKKLNLREACQLLILFFIVTPLINCIPYVYLRIFDGNALEVVVDSFFENISGTTTTGFTLLKGVELPKSLLLARAINQWVGGIGIVFILLSFFYPSKSLFSYAKAIGIEKLSESYKHSFFSLLFIYIFYTFLFIIILMILGIDPFNSVLLILTTISTTGLAPLNVFSLDWSILCVLILCMFLASISFTIHFNFFSGKFRKLINSELLLYLFLIFIFTSLFYLATGKDPITSLFYVLQTSSSTGFGMENFDSVAKSLLILIAIIGSCSFSAGGGMRIFRIYLLGKVLANSPHLIFGDKGLSYSGKIMESHDLVIHLLIIISFISLAFLGALVLVACGYNFQDSLLQSVSAVATLGISPIELSVASPLATKLTLICLMFLGRIEVLPLLIAFLKRGELEVRTYK